MALAADSTANYIPIETIYGRQNKDGTYTLTALDIKRLNDNLYNIVRKIQGGLTFSDLTDEASTVISDAEGNISSLEQTAEGLQVQVSSVAARNTVTINANGLYVTNAAGQTTQLSGDHIKSGTIEGVTLISDDGTNSFSVTIDNGMIKFSYGWQTIGYLKYDSSTDSFMLTNGTTTIPLKLRSTTNASIDAAGTLYLGSDSSYSNAVQIGRSGSGSRIDIYGDLYINGVAYGSEIGSGGAATAVFG